MLLHGLQNQTNAIQICNRTLVLATPHGQSKRTVPNLSFGEALWHLITARIISWYVGGLPVRVHTCVCAETTRMRKLSETQCTQDIREERY